jgi:hypothetical protein
MAFAHGGSNGIQRSFVMLSNQGCAMDAEEGDCRSCCSITNGWQYKIQFKRSEPIDFLAEQPVVTIDPPFPLEDMPWSGNPHIVSERLKTYLELRAPHHAQYFEADVHLPITVFNDDQVQRMLPKGRQKFLTLFPDGFDAKALQPKACYYAVNWLYALDCVDEVRSIRDSEPDDPNITYDVLTVDPSKIPEDILIFRPREQMFKVYIDTSLAVNILDEGFTGVQFYPIGAEYPPEWPWR